MKRALFTMGATLVMASALSADVTIRQTTGGKGMGVTGAGQTTTYIKGMKMRSEAEIRGTVMTTIYDVENQKMYIVDARKKSVDVWDMQAFGQEMAKSVETGAMKASVKPNGKKKDIAGKSATGYDLQVSVPAKLGGEEGMEMTVSLHGPMWVVKGAAGTED